MQLIAYLPSPEAPSLSESFMLSSSLELMSDMKSTSSSESMVSGVGGATGVADVVLFVGRSSRLAKSTSSAFLFLC